LFTQIEQIQLKSERYLGDFIFTEYLNLHS
jgi:hypothetical protein